MSAKRIMLLSEGFGTGHTKAAQALADGLKHLFPETDTCVMELGTVLNPKLVPVLLDAYRRTVSVQPELIGILYRKQYHKPLNGFTRLALHKLFYAKALRIISAWSPDAIVCSHPFPAAVIAHLKQQGLNIPLLTLITDYDAHGTWVNAEVDGYLAPAMKVRDVLISHGAEPSRISVTGLPVHPDFWSKGSKERIRRNLGLRNLPTALVMGGGWGITAQHEMLEQLIQLSGRIQLIICTGSNRKLYHQLHSNPQWHHPHVRILGYTHKISQLMDASDVLITKPGGMTCTEAMVKRIPMLFLPALPGQEEENRNYFVEQGYGLTLEHVTDLELAIEELIRIGDSRLRAESYHPQLGARVVHQLVSSRTLSPEYAEKWTSHRSVGGPSSPSSHSLGTKETARLS
ncbi:UDP-N-acetylglucosamine--LPS N-acetylglucosamine transferase [Paenibacillus massiliensis]|uniref:UDP-N-acetylglucosamine--LPS N-acetylglucosamine transferase n=1 Tax=Paenibacillus massiliensis TaxID=225917 RepID=UPI00042994C6|nr:UDP-N-acetylglucosamine--LPS N-acetylglucosamine transferase [Paenibacillus massiliensis]